MLKGVHILPVFDPESVGYWDDFMRIYTNTAQHNYNRQVNTKEYQDKLTEIKKIWSKNGFKFAFNAYYDGKTIGCILGESQDRQAYINHLYVDPEYQRNGVGMQLLSAAESASSLFYNKIDLISASGAYEFYQARNYRMHTAVNGYEKTIKNAGHCKVIPVFHCSSKLAQELSKISGTDCKKIQSQTPLFVYQDINSKIIAYGVVDTQTVYSGTGNRWAYDQITKNINKYHQHMCNQR